MNKTLFLIAVLLLAVVSFILILIFVSPKNSNQDIIVNPSPKAVSPQPEEINSDSAIPNDFREIPADNSSRVGQLMEELPYSGKLFLFSYDFSNDSFIIELDKQKISEAEREFDDYLKSKGLQRNELQKLVIR